MTKEEKQLLLKDLCARLPYGVKAQITSDGGMMEASYDMTLDCELLNDLIENGDDFKPYLRPMSSMTEDEQQKYYDLTHQEEDDIWGKCLFDKMVDFCNENHLDYRGLIEKGLALAAPENMYKED